MSESDRVHQPSPIRQLQAEQEGIIARSAELTRALTLCVVLGGCFVFAGTVWQGLSGFLVDSIDAVTVRYSSTSYATTVTGLWKLVSPLALFLIGLLIATLFFSHLQSPLKPRFHRLGSGIEQFSPANAWSRLFSLTNLIRTVILLLGFILALVVAFLFVRFNSGSLIGLAFGTLDQSLVRVQQFLKHVFLATGAIILVLGILDYVREKTSLAHRMKMTEQQRRDEARNSEMNPEVRRRILVEPSDDRLRPVTSNAVPPPTDA